MKLLAAIGVDISPLNENVTWLTLHKSQGDS